MQNAQIIKTNKNGSKMKSEKKKVSLTDQQISENGEISSTNQKGSTVVKNLSNCPSTQKLNQK